MPSGCNVALLEFKKLIEREEISNLTLKRVTTHFRKVKSKISEETDERFPEASFSGRKVISFVCGKGVKVNKPLLQVFINNKWQIFIAAFPTAVDSFTAENKKSH